ncbi:MAG TPA: glycosyl hydrolase, partial [Saprospiraceae bacterium]|nr:glycosyl hydrolase [Saprospiraceae bacterium]
GNNWNVISEDLTRQIDRNALKVMGRVWGVDAVAKNQSTSIYGNIVSLCESPLDPNLLYVGTDDGLIQVSTDRGKTWKKVDKIAGAPDTSFVNMIIASSHDANVVYSCFNHHKYGDFKPYLFVSKDKGMTWASISSNLPERGSVYSIAEDHVDPNLIFVGTSFGCYFTNSGGKSWKKLGSGLPTIAVRDMAIQKRENDLVLATFGRGFYVLDDYSSLRNISESNLSKEAMIMPVRDALSFEYSYPLGLPKQGFQGNDYYLGENLGHEALISFYIKDKIVTPKDARKKEDDKLAKDGKDTPYPTYEQLAKERDEEKAMRYLLIKDQAGNLVRKYSIGAGQVGLQRISWDLRSMDKEPVSSGDPSFYNPFNSPTEGPLVAPGTYTASLAAWQNGIMTAIGNTEKIVVKSLDHHALPAKDAAATVQFKRKVENDLRVLTATSNAIGDALSELGQIRKTIAKMETPDEQWMSDIMRIENELKILNRQLSGDPLKVQLDMDPTPSLSDRLNKIAGESKYSSSDPTGTHLMSLQIAEEELTPIVEKLRVILEKDMPALRLKLQEAGAPYTPNVIPAFKTKG